MSKQDLSVLEGLRARDAVARGQRAVLPPEAQLAACPQHSCAHPSIGETALGSLPAADLAFSCSLSLLSLSLDRLWLRCVSV
mmetsp:Transcript_61357/g.154930  ORF Transcript_61357/g.154930 Transcript_61357/m.154930 type:complete len:82 (-) Transcript_61357:122-367(-)